MNFETIFSWFLVLFSIIFSSIFRFFPKPLPETIFRGSKCRSCLKSTVLEPFWNLGGSEKRPLERHFRPKSRKKIKVFPGGSRPGADLGVRWSQKRCISCFFFISSPFGIVLRFIFVFCLISGSIFGNFGTDFRINFWSHFRWEAVPGSTWPRVGAENGWKKIISKIWNPTSPLGWGGLERYSFPLLTWFRFLLFEGKGFPFP